MYLNLTLCQVCSPYLVNSTKAEGKLYLEATIEFGKAVVHSTDGIPTSLWLPSCLTY